MIAAKLLKAMGICAALSFSLVPLANAAACVDLVRPARPVTAVRPVDTVSITDTVYTPIGNDVTTRLPASPDMVAPLDNLKLQIAANIATGILSGRITEVEAERLYAAMDDLAHQEAQFKVAGLNFSMINNLMRKYHMVNQQYAELAANTDTNDFMPSVENRRNMLSRRIMWHVTSANLSPAEGEQLLRALHAISDNYASYRATGAVFSADELEAVHKDLYNLHRKLIRQVSGTIAVVSPESVVPRQEYLRKIQAGVACGALTQAEGDCLIKQYNQLVLLEQSIACNEGVYSPDFQRLAEQIKTLDFILTRELRQRSQTQTTAGTSLQF